MTFRNRLTLLIALLTLGIATTTFAQQDKSKRPSPPAKAEASVGDLHIEINYSSPAVKGREIWGSLEPYNQVWRTGANEATTFEVTQNVTINGQALPAGKYALLSIPMENDEWVVIFNKEHNQWGAYNYNEEKDALRIKVKPGKTDELVERLKFDVSNNGIVTFKWENVTWNFEVKKA